MRTTVLVSLILILAVPLGAAELEKDAIPTDDGALLLTFVGHGSLVLEHHGVVVHVDPYSGLADYSELPPADLVLITHGHRDHLDPEAISGIRTERTRVVGPPSVCEQLDGCTPMTNGERLEVSGFVVEAVPAYNLVHERTPGEPFHPKGRGNGYVVAVAGVRVFIAGDTENTMEMKALEGIDVAFLPMNLPYTMTPEMVADAVRAFRPRVLYPYHYGDTDPAQLVGLLSDVDDVEVRIRAMR